MADKTTNWILRLKDMVTGPLDKIIQKGSAGVKQMAMLDKQMQNLESRASGLTSRLTKIGLGVGAFVALTYGSAQFEQGMAKANTMAGLGVEQFDALSEKIRDVANVVPLARTELADGLYETISNGVPENNWIQFLQDSGKAAVGGISDLKEVVGVTSTIIKNYGEEWSKAGLIQDKIQKTAVLGKTSFAEMGQALPKVTGNAATLGVNLDELLGSFSALTGVSGNTAEVSTQLGAIFTALIKPTSEATEMAKKMGIQFDALSIKKAGGMSKFFDVLIKKTEAYAKKTGVSTTEIYGKLLGSAEALRGFIPLTSSVAQDFQIKTGQIAGAAGTIETAFVQMSNTTNAKTQQMQNGFGNMTDEIFKASEPLRRVFFDGTGAILGWVAAFMGNFPNLTKFIILATGITVAIIGFTTAVTLVGLRLQMLHIKLLQASISGTGFTGVMARAALGTWGFVKSLAMGIVSVLRFGASMLFAGLQGLGGWVLGLVAATAAQIGLNIAMTANPIGLIIVGIAAAVAAIVILIKYWDQIKAAIVSFGLFIIKNHPFAWMFRLVDHFFPEFTQKIKDVFMSVVKWAAEMWAAIKGWFTSVADWMGFDMSNADIKMPAEGDGYSGGGRSGDTPPGPLTGDALFGAGASGDGSGGTTPAEPVSVGGGSGGGNTLNMTLNITNTFKIPEGFNGNFDKIVQAVTQQIVDSGRDALVTLGAS